MKKISRLAFVLIFLFTLISFPVQQAQAAWTAGGDDERAIAFLNYYLTHAEIKNAIKEYGNKHEYTASDPEVSWDFEQYQTYYRFYPTYAEVIMPPTEFLHGSEGSLHIRLVKHKQNAVTPSELSGGPVVQGLQLYVEQNMGEKEQKFYYHEDPTESFTSYNYYTQTYCGPYEIHVDAGATAKGSDVDKDVKGYSHNWTVTMFAEALHASGIADFCQTHEGREVLPPKLVLHIVTGEVGVNSITKYPENDMQVAAIAGDIIRTTNDGIARLNINNSGTVELDNNTEIEIKDLAARDKPFMAMLLKSGKIRNSIDSNSTSFKVSTPVAEIESTGTEFDVEHSDTTNETKVTVHDGSINLSNLNKSETVEVTADEIYSVNSAGAISAITKSTTKEETSSEEYNLSEIGLGLIALCTLLIFIIVTIILFIKKKWIWGLVMILIMIIVIFVMLILFFYSSQK